VDVVGKECLGLGYVVGRCLEVVDSMVVVEVERVVAVDKCLVVGVDSWVVFVGWSWRFGLVRLVVVGCFSRKSSDVDAILDCRLGHVGH
jgi:hypothetical protein